MPPPSNASPKTTPPTIRADLAEAEVKRAQRRQARQWAIGVGLSLAAILLAVFVWRWVLADLPTIPSKDALWSVNRPPGVRFLDRNGEVLAQRGFRHGAPVALSDLPPYVAKAMLAAEDRRFYWHIGVDPIGLARAVSVDLLARRARQGASTLTQQVARETLLTPETSLKRKVQEAILALALERRLSKSEILTLYLNRTYFGSGAYGVEAAAQTYFAKPARLLSLSEAALLASLPKAPSRLDPTNDMARALRRSHLVLERMHKEGWITDVALGAALASPPTLADEPQESGDLGYALDVAETEARRVAPVGINDLVVVTSLDPKLQSLGTKALRDGVAQAKRRGATTGALIALATDGGVVAMVGGLDHKTSPFNRTLQARRQPGSAFKPFVYATALEQGLSPSDVRPDAPFRQGDYAPENADGVYRGNVSLTEALSHSINTVAVRLTDEVGPQRVAQLAYRFGVRGLPVSPGLPIALGAYETTLADLAGGYQVFQRGGLKIYPWIVAEVRDSKGATLWHRSEAQALRVYAPDLDAAMVGMMRKVIEDPGGTGHRARLDRPAAGKTGTSQNARDAWFIGFTADYLCGVWIGDDQNRPMPGEQGGDTPAEIWKVFMQGAHKGLPVRGFETVGQGDPRLDFYRKLQAAFEDPAEILGPEPANPAQ